jgi:Crinkler effector protein N-terminal domain
MLDTAVLSQDGSRKLRCVIEGESIIFSVIARCDWDVGDLKEDILKKRELDALKDVGPHTLELWKVSVIG